MPVLPPFFRRAVADAADTRIIESRQVLDSASSRYYCLRGGFISACYQGIDAGPSAGAVVGIVLGSVVGFLLILWVLWVLSQSSGFIRTSALVEREEDVVVRTRSRSPRSRRSHRSTYNAEMRQHTSPRRERVVRQERIVRDIPPPVQRETSRVRESIIEEEIRPERRVEGDDIVEVIEEHSSVGGGPPPRRKSRRSSGYR